MKMQITWVDTPKVKMKEELTQEEIECLEIYERLKDSLLALAVKNTGIDPEQSVFLQTVKEHYEKQIEELKEQKNVWKGFNHKLLKDEKAYLVRWLDSTNVPSMPILSFWSETEGCFFLCNGEAVPIVVDQFMEIPE
jgi:hypothetical protein